MDLEALAHVIRREWKAVAATITACFLLCGLYLAAAPRIYESRFTLFVTVPPNDQQRAPNELLSGSTFAQQRAKSYARVITSPLVLTPVDEQLQLGEGGEGLSRNVVAEVPLDSVLIDVTVSSNDRERASAIGRAIVQNFRRVLPTVEGSANVPVDVTVIAPPAAPSGPQSPNAKIALAAAALFSVIASIAVAILNNSRRRRLSGR